MQAKPGAFLLKCLQYFSHCLGVILYRVPKTVKIVSSVYNLGHLHANNCWSW